MYAKKSTPSSHVSVAANCKFDFFDENNAVIGGTNFSRYGTAYKRTANGDTTPLVANGVINFGSHSVTYTKIGEIYFFNYLHIFRALAGWLR